MSSEENVSAASAPEIVDDEEEEMTIRELPTFPSAQNAGDNFQRDAVTVIAEIEEAPPRAPLTMESSGLHEVDEQQIVGDGATTVQNLAELEAQLQHRHAVFSSKTAQIAIGGDDEPTQGPVSSAPQVDAAPIGGPEPAVEASLDPSTVLTPLPVSGLHHEDVEDVFSSSGTGAAEAPALTSDTHHPALEDTAERSVDATFDGGLSSIPEPLPDAPPLAAHAYPPIEVTPTHLNARAIEDDVEGVQIRRWQVTPVRVAPPAPPKAVATPQSPVHTRLTTILFDAELGADAPAETPKASWGTSAASEESADSALAGQYVSAALEDIDALLPLGLELSAESRRLFHGGLQGLAQKLRRARALLPEGDEP